MRVQLPTVLRRHRLDVGWILATTAAMLAVAPTFALITDVRFSLGGLRAAEGFTAAEIFLHRPILNRILMALLDAPLVGPLAARELQLMILSVGLVGLATYYLARRLGARIGAVEGVVVGLTLLLSLAWAPTLDFLQPEWCAVVLGVVSIGAALRAGPDTVRRVIGVGLVSGTLLSLVVLMKYTTGTTALLAWGVIMVLDARRGLAAAAGAAVVTPALFGLGVLLAPHEWLWFTELAQLNPTPDGRWLYFWRALLNEPMLSPVLVMFAAALVTLVRLSRGWRRLGWALLPPLGVAAVIGGFIAQSAWYQYHLSVLPPLVAALWGLALVRSARLDARPHPGLVLPALAVGLGAALLQNTSAPWREAHQSGAILLLAASGSVALVWCAVGPWRSAPGGEGWRSAPGGEVWRSAPGGEGWRSAPGGEDRPRGASAPPPAPRGRVQGWLGPSAAGLAVLAVLGVTILPWAHVEYLTSDGSSWTRANRIAYREKRVESSEVIRQRIGADTPVAYLAGGPQVYFVGNPTPCRYPVSVVLGRSRDLPVSHLRTFAENLACLDDPRARFLVINPGWMNPSKVDPQVRDAVRSNFDCAHPAVETKPLLVCPRR